ncbi:MAG TPA: type VI secretion system needle protein Hcp [Dysgonomonas sp.]|nr:type VI secretion system needle protein Hcp [Dysgonomonas sp.]
MAFRSNLNFEGKDYDILQCDYSFHRDIDLKGRPSSNVYGGRINIEVESTEDSTILSQMVNQFKPNSGTITFNRGDEEAKMKELSWENGYVIDYSEELDVVGREPMKIRFVISAEKMKMESVEVEQKWPK